MQTKTIFRFLNWIISVLMIIFINNALSGSPVFAEETINYPHTKTFNISAYYSPLPCQSHYVTGSYDGDVRLNGEGVHSADGSLVYPGMIAAPGTYAFNTKMEIPGIGIVAVHDRGGAIVNGNGINSYDRLDVWMGYGDKGLERALNWGRRTIEVVIYGVNENINEQVTLNGYDESESIMNCNPSITEIAKTDFSTLLEPEVKNTATVKTASIESITPDATIHKTENGNEISTLPTLNKDLKFGDSGIEVSALQTHLKELNFFKTGVTSNFGEVTKHAVYKFQQSQGLVPDESSPYAGIFGPKTRDRLNEIIQSANYNNLRIASATVEYNKIMVAQLESDRPRKEAITIELAFGMSNPEVAKLQRILKDLGFFDGALITEYYGPVTQKAVLKFQKSKNIIKSESDSGAGKVGTETMEIINTIVI